MEEIRTETPIQTPESHFDGTTLQLIGWRLLGWLLSIVTLGIGAAWAQCMVLRWETKHTIVEGRRLRFDGKGHQLLGRYLLWGFLTIITLGIYAIFIPVRMEKWRVSHTRFAAPGEMEESSVSGMAILAGVLAAILGLVLLAGGVYLVSANWESLKELVAEPTEPQPNLEGFEGLVSIIDGQGNIIYIPMESLPVQEEPEIPEATYAEGVYLPNPNDDADYWYVNNPKEGLNLRYGPGTEYDVIRNLPHGTEIQVLTWENGWAFTGEGWVAGNYLQINPPKEATSKEESDKSIVGTWGFIREHGNNSDEERFAYYYVTMIRFNKDGTFRSETAAVSYSEIGGSWGWVPEGIRPGSELRGSYSYDGSTLRLDYADGTTVKTSARWDGEKLKLGDPQKIITGVESSNYYKEGKSHAMLTPLDDDVDIYFDLPGFVRRYVG